WPDEGVCVPAEVSSAAVARGAKAEAAVPDDDGTVWFTPVEAGDGAFKNLVGNVAEYTFEDAAPQDPLPAPIERIRSLIGKGDSVRMIGASALSAREVEPGRAYHLPKGADASRAGFSDVGFRLAFSLGPAAPAAPAPDP